MSPSDSDDLSEAEDPPGAPEYIPGQGTETAEIPIRIEDGEVHLDESKLDPEDSGGESASLPDLRDGATGTLRVQASSLKDDQDRRRFTGEHLEIIVPRSNLIWLKIGTDRSAERPEFAEIFLRESQLPVPKRRWRLIPVALQDHLWLRHRGAKKPIVEGGDCALPKYLREKAGEMPEVLESPHQAYHTLSQIFETHRRTHGGSVYKKGYVWNPDVKDWIGLEDFRTRTVTGSVWGGPGGDNERKWLRPWWYSEKEEAYETIDAWLWLGEENQMWAAEAYPLDPLDEERPRTQVEAAEALDEKGYRPSIQVRKDDFSRAVPPEDRNWNGLVPWEP
jgi:hypothetical protein